MADQPVRTAAQANPAAAGSLSPVPGWAGMTQVVLLRVCSSLHPLQTLLCAAFCAPEAVVSGLLPVARDQRMLVPVGALRHMLLAIACLGHIQQRPGSDLPQLRAGVLQWVTSPGLPAVEVFEVTSHLVWTHQTTDHPRRLLGPPSLFATPTRSSLDPDGRHAVWPIAGLLSKHYNTVQPIGTRWTRLTPPFSAALAGCGASGGRMGTRMSSGDNGMRAAGACQRYFSALCPCGVMG
jgi:hypothetical protein